MECSIENYGCKNSRRESKRAGPFHSTVGIWSRPEDLLIGKGLSACFSSSREKISVEMFSSSQTWSKVDRYLLREDSLEDFESA